MITIKDPISFEWDTGNQDKNWNKHNVSQEEAEQVFFDPYRLVRKDHLHSANESRYVVVGETQKARLLFLVFTVRNDKVRVISARDMKTKFKQHYYKKRGTTYEKAS